MVQAVVPFGVPRASPTATAVGLRLDSVMPTAPAWTTVNVYRFEPRKANAPAKVSVVVVEDVVEDDDELGLKRLHAALARANPSAKVTPRAGPCLGVKPSRRARPRRAASDRNFKA